ncbi:MAG: hypothetical protein JW712_11190 [Dehalococcoidales bacterium]|nr:hypothetical protein [Dehalococcoidales bacterium]
MSIVIGNDELILYVRKHNPTCKLHNDELEQKISGQIKSLDPDARIVQEGKASYWDLHGVSVSRDKLPMTTNQFEFNRDILPKLYDFLDQVS